MHKLSPRYFGATLRLGVGLDAIALVESRRWGREHSLLAELPLDGGVAFPAALAAGIGVLFDGAACSRWPLSVVLADELTRLWQVTPPPACARLGDLEAAAALRFQQLYGEPAASWQLSADWQLQQPFMAAAVPRAVLAAVQQGANLQAMPLVAVAPQFLALFNRHHKTIGRADWLGAVHDGVLTLGVCGDAGLLAVRAIGLGPGPASDTAWLKDTLAREALRLNAPAPARLLLCGDAVPAWRDAAFCVRVGGESASGLSAAARLALSGAAA